MTFAEELATWTWEYAIPPPVPAAAKTRSRPVQSLGDTIKFKVPANSQSSFKELPTKGKAVLQSLWTAFAAELNAACPAGDADKKRLVLADLLDGLVFFPACFDPAKVSAGPLLLRRKPDSAASCKTTFERQVAVEHQLASSPDLLLLALGGGECSRLKLGPEKGKGQGIKRLSSRALKRRQLTRFFFDLFVENNSPAPCSDDHPFCFLQQEACERTGVQPPNYKETLEGLLQTGSTQAVNYRLLIYSKPAYSEPIYLTFRPQKYKGVAPAKKVGEERVVRSLRTCKQNANREAHTQAAPGYCTHDEQLVIFQTLLHQFFENVLKNKTKLRGPSSTIQRKLHKRLTNFCRQRKSQDANDPLALLAECFLPLAKGLDHCEDFANYPHILACFYPLQEKGVMAPPPILSSLLVAGGRSYGPRDKKLDWSEEGGAFGFVTQLLKCINAKATKTTISQAKAIFRSEAQAFAAAWVRQASPKRY